MLGGWSEAAGGLGALQALKSSQESIELHAESAGERPCARPSQSMARRGGGLPAAAGTEERRRWTAHARLLCFLEQTNVPIANTFPADNPKRRDVPVPELEDWIAS